MTELDELMSLDPLKLTKDNIGSIIDYYRKARATGAKPKKESGPKADVSEVFAKLLPKATEIRRR